MPGEKSRHVTVRDAKRRVMVSGRDWSGVNRIHAERLIEVVIERRKKVLRELAKH